MQKITFEPKQAINGNAHRKEDKFDSQMTLVHRTPIGLEDAIICRWYFTGTRYYCCVWVKIRSFEQFKTARIPEKGYYANGSDYAGGGGYCKKSASAYGAFVKAGFAFTESFSGRGEEAVRKAMLDIAKKLKLKNATVFHAHG